ncbi:MAG: hypothetical protein JWP63_4408 [Candidatus Solibacter sp.]|jgi:hypothetical protein|nr:hypothetical protein [Candidatus Solibacter sp.]
MELRRRLVPAAIWFALIASAVAGAAFHVVQLMNPASLAPEKALQQSHLIHAAAYVLVALLCGRIRADYPARSGMRTAWSLVLASAVMAILRNGYEWLVMTAGWMVTPLRGWHHIPLALSHILLAAALIAMWKSLTALGFGRRFRWSDYVWAGLILAGAFWIWSFRAGMSDAQSEFRVIRVLQLLTPIMYAVPALIALGLLRISDEMEGGALATSLRYLIAFHLIRMALLAVGLTPALSFSPGWMAVKWAASWSYTWVFALGVAHRWQLTVSATELEERYEADPESELAALSRAVGTLGRR